MLQRKLSSDAIRHIAWFELRSEADGEILRANLSENNPPERARGRLYLNVDGAPSRVPSFDAWRADPAAAGAMFRIDDIGVLVMLGWSWDEAETRGDPTGRCVVEALHAQARDEWVDEAAEAIAAGRDGYEVEAALLDRWHARRRGMTERDERPLVPSIDLLLAAPWFIPPPDYVTDMTIVASHANGWVIATGDEGYFYLWDADQVG